MQFESATQLVIKIIFDMSRKLNRFAILNFLLLEI